MGLDTINAHQSLNQIGFNEFDTFISIELGTNNELGLFVANEDLDSSIKSAELIKTGVEKWKSRSKM